MIHILEPIGAMFLIFICLLVIKIAMNNKRLTEKYLLKNGFKYRPNSNIIDKEFSKKNKNGLRLSLWMYKGWFGIKKFYYLGLFKVKTKSDLDNLWNNLSTEK